MINAQGQQPSVKGEITNFATNWKKKEQYMVHMHLNHALINAGFNLRMDSPNVNVHVDRKDERIDQIYSVNQKAIMVISRFFNGTTKVRTIKPQKLKYEGRRQRKSNYISIPV